MKVAIHQPQYFPWPPYLHKAMSADVFVYLDTVQFSKNGVQNRNRIKTPQGAQWLTLPVGHELGRSIADTRLADARTLEKHWKTIAGNYARTPGFALWRDELAALFEAPYGSLADVAVASTEWLLGKLGARTRRLRASGIAEAEGQASQLVASICRAVGATRYLSGTGALAYMREADFSEIGCELMVQRWTPFEYPQAYPAAGFCPDLSCLDLVLNAPGEAAGLIDAAGSWVPFKEGPDEG